MLTWWSLESSHQLPPTQEITIIVKNFPVDYYHRNHFRQAVSSMGTLLEVLFEGSNGEDRHQVRLVLSCPDRSLIPPFLYVGHGSRISECPITIEDDQNSPPYHPVPPPVPPPPPPSAGAAVPIQVQRWTPLYFPPGRRCGIQMLHRTPSHDTSSTQRYIPPWRRSGLGNLLPEINRLGKGHQVFWPTAKGCTPGLSGTLASSDKTSLSTPTVRCRCQFPDLWQNHHAYPPRDRIQSRSNFLGISQHPRDTCHIPHPQMVSTHTNPSLMRIPNTPLPGHDKIGFHHRGMTAEHSHSGTLTALHSLNSCPPHLSDKPSHTGNHTSSLLYSKTLNLSKTAATVPNSLLLSSFSPLSPAPSKSYYPKTTDPRRTMANITPEDEALIQRFVGLTTAEEALTPVNLPLSAATSTNWEYTLLVRIISDRTVMDNQFISNMLIAWKVHPDTIFRPVMRNLYLIEFVNQEDLYSVSLGGPWTYRGDLVAPRRVSSQADLHPSHIVLANLWVQFFNLPVNSLTEEGLDILAGELGTRVSPPVDGFLNGKRFIKLKIMVNIEKPLKDRVVMTHPILGPLTAHCYFEKVTRICNFCGLLGHDLPGCNDRTRLIELLQQPCYAGQYNMKEVLTPKWGKWMTSAGCIPRGEDTPTGQRNKRHFGQDFHYGTSNLGQLGQDLRDQAGPQVPDAQGLPSSTSASLHQPKRPRPAGLNSPARDI